MVYYQYAQCYTCYAGQLSSDGSHNLFGLLSSTELYQHTHTSLKPDQTDRMAVLFGYGNPTERHLYSLGQWSRGVYSILPVYATRLCGSARTLTNLHILEYCVGFDVQNDWRSVHKCSLLTKISSGGWGNAKTLAHILWGNHYYPGSGKHNIGKHICAGVAVRVVLLTTISGSAPNRKFRAGLGSVPTSQPELTPVTPAVTQARVSYRGTFTGKGAVRQTDR